MKSFIKNWNEKRKRILPVVLSVLMMSMCFSQTVPQTAEAASSKKAVKTVTLKANGKKVNKKTVTVKKGAKVKLTVTVSPAKARKSVTFKTSNKKIATVSKKGVITAKNKKGTAKITVKVKGKNGKTTTTWLKVYVEPKHTWKKHTATKKVWVPNIVTVDDYETITHEIWNCNCGEKVEDIVGEHISAHLRAGEVQSGDKVVEYNNGELFPLSDDVFACDYIWRCGICKAEMVDEVVTHIMPHFATNTSNGGWHSATIEKKKTGSHTEDHGSYKTTKYVDYYYCNCGAKKK